MKELALPEHANGYLGHSDGRCRAGYVHLDDWRIAHAAYPLDIHHSSHCIIKILALRDLELIEDTPLNETTGNNPNYLGSTAHLGYF